MASTTRAAAPPKPSRGAGGGGLHKQVMGLPAWMWGVGGVVLIGGYLYLRSHASPTTGKGQGQGQGGGKPIVVASPTGLSYEQFLLLLEDWQKSHGQGGKGHGRHGGGHHTNPSGPERKWLEEKTGSKHPWTYLAQHHERIIVGPHGSRTITHDPPHRKGKR